jgi:actin related protein 2/3 complex subunit 2
MASTAPPAKGMILLEARSAILYEQLRPRILDNKRDPCEISFYDFDDVGIRIACQETSPNFVSVHLAIRNIVELKRMGAQEVIDRLYPGLETTPADGYNFAIRFDCDTIVEKERFLDNVAEIRKNILGGPIDKAFNSLLAKQSAGLTPMVVNNRHDEPMFVVENGGKIIVIFAVDFPDETDRTLAKVFLQEFEEVQRMYVRNAPPCLFSPAGSPPGELSRVTYTPKSTLAGFLSFSVEERHIAGPGKNNAIALLTSFRNYLHYHIKSSKTYLHMRMRKKVAGWMLVLNRAKPEIETEKKTATGKTFVMK